MDGGSRNPDRADPLRALRVALARGASQVLQQSLRPRASELPIPDQPHQRSGGSGDGNAADLTARCEHCSGPLPAGAPAHRRFCSTACLRASTKAAKVKGRADAVAGRVCAHCGGAIDPGRKMGAIFCGQRCAERHAYAAARAERFARRPVLPCACCGAPLQADRRVDAKFCSQSCRARMRKGIRKSCPHCREAFWALRPDQVHCSRACRWAAYRKGKMGFRASGFCGPSPQTE